MCPISVVWGFRRRRFSGGVVVCWGSELFVERKRGEETTVIGRRKEAFKSADVCG